MVVNGSGFGGCLMMKELRKAEKVLCVSKTVGKSVPFNNKVLLYNALEHHGELKKRKGEKFVVSVVGSVVPVKGFDVFVDSYKFLKQKGSIEYRIYGTGYLEEELKNRINEIENRCVKMMGFRKNILEELAESSVLVVPTLIEESFSLVVLQAFLIGIPCVATNIGGQAENIIEGVNGFLVPVNDAKSIAEKIDYLLTHPEDYERISNEARNTYQKFSYGKFEENIISIFSNS